MKVQWKLTQGIPAGGIAGCGGAGLRLTEGELQQVVGWCEVESPSGAWGVHSARRSLLCRQAHFATSLLEDRSGSRHQAACRCCMAVLQNRAEGRDAPLRGVDLRPCISACFPVVSKAQIAGKQGCLTLHSLRVSACEQANTSNTTWVSAAAGADLP